MAKKVSALIRTVRIVKPYSVQNLNGRNGAFQQKMVMFVGATDREYKQTITNADGTVSKERGSDFFTFKATGPIADLFNQYCSQYKDDGQGGQKLVSRRLLVTGHDETYTKEIVDQIQTPDGQVYNVPRKETRTITVVDNIEFIDGNPANKNGAAPQAQAIQAVAAPVQAQAVAPVAPQVAQTVAAPAAPVAQAVSGEVAPF